MKPEFKKYTDELVPVIIQDAETKQVLMLGFMNEVAFEKSVKEGKVTFFSRSRQQLWTKGETSGNYLTIKEIHNDCDNDTLLIKVIPAGPVCHTGTTTCFKNDTLNFSLEKLEQIISDRKNNPTDKSYTSSLFAKGINKVAQKVGEEAIELVIESKDDDRELFLGEAADLMFHYLILLQQKKLTLNDVIKTLEVRHNQKK